MQINTLKNRLRKIEQLEKSAYSLEIDIKQQDVERVKQSILEEFLSQNAIAKAVYRGEDSYQARIQPILNKYSTFLNRIFIPKQDTEFDDDLIKTVDSMNLVGVKNCDPIPLTTYGRKKNVLFKDKLSLFLGACFATMTLGAMAITPEYSASPRDITNPIFRTLLDCSPGLAIALPYTILKPTHSWDIGYSLRSVSQSALLTDNYLRQLSI